MYTEAQILLGKYIQDVDHMIHLTHTPSLQSTLDEVYACLNHQGQIKSGSMILILSIFASASHSWRRQDRERGLCLAVTEATSLSTLWVKAVEDVLDIAHRTTSISLEGVQGTIMAMFVIGNFEGFSRRTWSLLNTSLLIARQLGLHRLDHPSNASLANCPRTEMGRRVWWFIVACDWSAPTLPKLKD